jgi:endonuclease/exonuclease/phosphatase (EEP) superfamily protein YafD
MLTYIKNRFTFLQSLTFLLALLFIFSRLGNIHWAFDWFALVQERYFFLGLILTILLAYKRDWRWMSVALIVTIFSAILIMPYYIKTQSLTQPAQARVLVYNLYYLNPDLPSAVTEIKKHNADVVFLMEYSEDIQSKIENQFEEYPYRLIRPSRMTMGLAIFSKIPLDYAEIHRNEETRIPVFDVQFQIAGQPVNFVAGHAWPPMPQWGALSQAQSREIIRVAEERAQTGLPLIVAGDFNATQWSAIFAEIENNAQVKDARLGFGLSLTHKGGWLYGLSLDHVLVSEHFEIINFFTSDMAGSDHTPIIIDLILK